MQRDPFHAISDPTRRQIIDLVASRSLPVNEIAEHFEISRPAISKHIKILNECDLLTVRKSGRKRYCRADLGKLSEVAAWVWRYRNFWADKLDALEEALNEDMNPKQHSEE